MANLLEVHLVGAANDKKTMFIQADKIETIKSNIEIDGKSIRETVDSNDYNDYKIIDFYVHKNIILK